MTTHLAPAPARAPVSAEQTIPDSGALLRFQLRNFKSLLWLAAASIAYWIAIAVLPAGSDLLGLGLVGGLVFLITRHLIRRQFVEGLAMIAYLAAVQPAIRLYIPQLPYLFLDYAFVIWALMILAPHIDRLKLSSPVFWYGLFIVLETLFLLRADSFTFGRTVLIPNITLLLILLIAAQLRLNYADLRRVFIWFLAGAFSIAALAGRIYFSGALVEWSTSSNFDASGGMGPNQVSFLLATAAFICILLGSEARGWLKIMYWVISFGAAYLMVLTFSRGGIYLLTASVLAYILFSNRLSLRTTLAILLAGVGLFVVFQVAADTTQGLVIDRYREFDAENRVVLAEVGLRIFADNPLFGVGTGNYYVVVSERELFGSTSGAHNEWIRAAAEMGVLGLVTWSAFALSSLRQSIIGGGRSARALRVVFLGLGLVSMLYNGLKLVTQPYLFLIALTANEDQSTVPDLAEEEDD
ncbi:MAG: O-antigen ligase family protein [Anaerolineales bacterium]|nr:O-antigen ligase family protein [Anaerolineales bacterium]